MTLPNRKCDTCGSEYTPSRESSRFCSHSCAARGTNGKRTIPLEKRSCAVCGKEFEAKPRSPVECCSRKCGSQLRLKRMDMKEFAASISAGKRGKTHAGVPHTEATKLVLKEKARLRMSDPSRNPFLGKSRSFESRDKQSKTRSQRFVDGTYRWHTWHESGEVISTKLGKAVWYRSSWEKKLIQMLDEDASVTTFQAEPFSIPYYRKEGERENLRHYVPDFLVTYDDGRKVLMEVKPECFVDADMNLAKFAAAQEHCQKNGWEFRVLTQKELCI